MVIDINICNACPYNVICFNWDLNIAQKCTFCAHLLDNGCKEPRCVDACPTGAFTFGEEEDLKDKIAKAEILLPENNTKPRVYYIGIPKRFIAGAIYDPEEDECIEGAMVTLNKGSRKVATAKADNFGDFWFEGLDVGQYSVSIIKPRYLSQEIKSISANKDVNMGDIKLCKEESVKV